MTSEQVGQFKQVAHDAWCRFIRSRGQEECNCEPTISYVPAYVVEPPAHDDGRP